MRFSNKNKAEGFAATGIVLILVVVLVAGIAGYTVISRNNDDPSSGNSALSKDEQSKVEAECKKEIDDKDFCKFVSTWTLDSEYKLTVKTTGGNDSGSFVSETDGEGNSSTVFSSDSGEQSKFISLNGATYIYDSSTESWIKYPATESVESTEAVADVTEEFDFDDSDLPEAEQSTYKALGKEDCGSKKCFKYQIIDPATPNMEQFVWFDDDNYELYKFQSIEDGVTTEMTVEQVDVKITEPSPVTEFDASGGMTEQQMQELMDSYSN